MAELKLKRVDGKEKYRIDRKIKIGRHPDNDLVVKAEGVSRFHCEIDLDHEQNIFVKDIGSANGTYINDSRIEQAAVHENDVLQIGTVKYIFLAATPSAATRQATPVRTRIEGIIIKPLNHESRQYFWPVNSVSTIGRLASNNIPINDGSISRRHTQIEVKEDRVIISDLASANGTFVNKQRIQQQNLKNGDIVGVGSFQFAITFEMRNYST